LRHILDFKEFVSRCFWLKQAAKAKQFDSRPQGAIVDFWLAVAKI
jgi:hypothetical protein